MAADGGVGHVEDGTRIERIFGGAENLLDHPELVVAQGDVEGAQDGIGPQGSLAVEALFLAGLVMADLDGVLAGLG